SSGLQRITPRTNGLPLPGGVASRPREVIVRRRTPMRQRFARLVESIDPILCAKLAMFMLCAAAATPSAAIVTYQYTGKPYVIAGVPYNLSMSVDGTITLSTPLPANI